MKPYLKIWIFGLLPVLGHLGLDAADESSAAPLQGLSNQGSYHCRREAR